MENFYLVDYIRKNFNIDEDILDSIKSALDKQIYYFGDHFIAPRENTANISLLLKKVFYDAVSECSFMYNALSRHRPLTKENNIISDSYYSVNDELRKIGYNVYKPFWCSVRCQDVSVDLNLYRESKAINDILENGDFADHISEKFIKKIKDFREHLKNFYIANNASALIVPNDASFFENLSIKIFKEIKKPSFIFLHGLPGRYNKIDENRSDYLIVWGDKIKENYINAGFPGSKILVSGHPSYKEFHYKELKFDVENILIITNVSFDTAQDGEGAYLSDRGNSILYLYSIQNVLEKIGIRSVRLRVHPCENRKWYYKFIDKDFFKLDNEDLDNSLKKSTLVIGPTSTVFLAAVYHGVNYLIYEPAVNDIGLMNIRLVPPFDGRDKRIPVAKDESELTQLLVRKTKTDVSFFNDYIKTPFDISFIKNYIKDK